MTLQDLPKLYAEAREQASAAAKYSAEAAPPDMCRYCGKHLRLFMTGRCRLDGHARCCVTLEFQIALYRLWRTTIGLNKTKIAQVCDVSVMAVERWIANAERSITASAGAARR